jgi:LmbE family N-acetylglucosaminyl deacetylase
MQKILFGIFAHPDDEAFGPSATLLQETQNGTELHLITLTAGEAGMNPDNHDNLPEVRLKEWRKAGELIGATSMHHLGYTDGTLCNRDHLTATDQITELVQEVIRGREDVEVEFMSIDLNGITGHIDHIVAGRSACLAFCRLRDARLPMSRIRLACMPRSRFSGISTHFVFMEAGHPDNTIDEVIDARHLASKVHEIMRCHHTQRGDADMHINRLGDDVAVNYFIVPEF